MSYLTGSSSKDLGTSMRARQTPTSPEPKILQEITVAEYERHAGDQYRNHGQNLMLTTALQAVEKQKEFTGAAAEEFARVFTTQTSKLVEAIKAREEWHKVFPPQLPLPLKEPKLRSFPNKNGESRKMTGTKAALAAEADRIREIRKAKKEKRLEKNMKLSWLLLGWILFLRIWDLFLHLFRAESQDYQSLNYLQQIPA